jgi:hypothetical protein
MSTAPPPQPHVGLQSTPGEKKNYPSPPPMILGLPKIKMRIPIGCFMHTHSRYILTIGFQCPFLLLFLSIIDLLIC